MGTVEPQNEVILLVRVRLAANTRKPIPSWLDSHDGDFDDFTRRSPGGAAPGEALQGFRLSSPPFPLPCLPLCAVSSRLRLKVQKEMGLPSPFWMFSCSG